MGTTITSFEDIIAWQKARELNKEVYLITNNELLARDFSLKDQIRRSSVSVMSNIAEGYERRGDKEFLRFLTIAKSSGAELKSLMFAALDIGYIAEEEFLKIVRLIDETSKLIQGFKTYLKNSQSDTKTDKLIDKQTYRLTD
jgi:four helix bundle protein